MSVDTVSDNMRGVGVVRVPSCDCKEDFSGREVTYLKEWRVTERNLLYCVRDR